MTQKQATFGKRDSPPVRRPPARRRRPILKYSLITLAVLLSAAMGAGAWLWHQTFHDMPVLPETSQMWVIGRTPATEFRAMDGTVLDIRGPRYGQLVRLADLPAHVPQAFIAAEDKRFYEHDGADTWAIARAAWSNWRSGRTVSGASTLTQQLVKNLVLSPERTLKRKAQEARLARRLEQRLTKDQILELYLNRAYFGAGFHGLDAASRHYFGIPPEDLSIGQSALLASLPKAPSRLALTDNLEAARARQAYVLSEMVSSEYLTASQAAAAREEEVNLVERAPSDPDFGYALDLAAEQIRTYLPDAPPDLVVTVTIEPELQAQVQDVIARRIREEGPGLNAGQAAGVMMRPDGRVAVLVGGVDYASSQFNRATQARRQPGSAFKAVVYAAALARGADPYDIREDGPLKIGKWQPENYAGGFLGPVTLSEAYARSLNTVSVRLSREIGEEAVIAMGRALGIEADMQPLPSIALGSQEVTLWDMTRAFGAFMKEGVRLDPWIIASIEDARGNLIYERPPAEPFRVLETAVARDMNAMMIRVVDSGTGEAASVPGWAIAGKTGTSQDWRDAWFIGYSSTLVAGVWVGNDDDSPMAKVTGGDLPARIFSEAMGIALEGQRAAELAGAERHRSISKAAEQRIAFYRELSGAFASVSGRDVASLDGASLQ
jgi:penicillin-binding protein 1A